MRQIVEKKINVSEGVNEQILTRTHESKQSSFTLTDSEWHIFSQKPGFLLKIPHILHHWITKAWWWSVARETLWWHFEKSSTIRTYTFVVTAKRKAVAKTCILCGQSILLPTTFPKRFSEEKLLPFQHSLCRVFFGVHMFKTMQSYFFLRLKGIVNFFGRERKNSNAQRCKGFPSFAWWKFYTT